MTKPVRRWTFMAGFLSTGERDSFLADFMAEIRLKCAVMVGKEPWNQYKDPTIYKSTEFNLSIACNRGQYYWCEAFLTGWKAGRKSAPIPMIKFTPGALPCPVPLYNQVISHSTGERITCDEMDRIAPELHALAHNRIKPEPILKIVDGDLVVNDGTIIGKLSMRDPNEYGDSVILLQQKIKLSTKR